ncbi:hypothetical protein [Paracoccus sp. (in: a-proteobacteria)]|uniref:hypothetical protein n=1 Tax=Paracoccus sp. TaxID=267 RepID=UPI0026DF764B|nr:hypothetical protein [Paracoccus sp. (in: a-proteobacteria)]MDO5647327.1 hypothetical protein [Paracoccus sp. (in: a-proteobacteria)]
MLDTVKVGVVMAGVFGIPFLIGDAPLVLIVALVAVFVAAGLWLAHRLFDD